MNSYGLRSHEERHVVLWLMFFCSLGFSFQVSRAFIAARALSQGLATGRDIVNKATKVSDILSLYFSSSLDKKKML